MAIFESLIGSLINVNAKYKSDNNTNSGNTTNSNNSGSTIENSTENIGDKVEQTVTKAEQAVPNLHDNAPFSDNSLSSTTINDKELDKKYEFRKDGYPCDGTGPTCDKCTHGSCFRRNPFNRGRFQSQAEFDTWWRANTSKREL